MQALKGDAVSTQRTALEQCVRNTQNSAELAALLPVWGAFAAQLLQHGFSLTQSEGSMVADSMTAQCAALARAPPAGAELAEKLHEVFIAMRKDAHELCTTRRAAEDRQQLQQLLECLTKQL